MLTSTVKPDKMGSYKEDDVTFLLRDIGQLCH